MLEPSKHIGAGRKGKAVEHLVAASCILASRGELNASTSLVDDEGVDVVFHRRGRSRTVAVQIKSRFSDEVGSKLLRERRLFRSDVRAATFRARSDLYMLFVAVDADDATYGPVWLVPSRDFERLALRVGNKLRINASAKPDSRDQWRRYRLERSELAPSLLAKLEVLEGIDDSTSQPEIPGSRDDVLNRYRRSEISIGRAAEESGLSHWELIDLIRESDRPPL